VGTHALLRPRAGNQALRRRASPPFCCIAVLIADRGPFAERREIPYDKSYARAEDWMYLCLYPRIGTQASGPIFGGPMGGMDLALLVSMWHLLLLISSYIYEYRNFCVRQPINITLNMQK
jgi:hypothetical protein